MTALGTLGIGLYVHAVAVAVPRDKGFFDGISALGLWNVALVAPAVCFWFAELTKRNADRAGRRDTSQAIERVIESMVRGYVFPEGWGHDQYRAYCHRIDKTRCNGVDCDSTDKKRCTLRPVAVASPVPAADERVPLPACGKAAADLVIANAFNQRKAVCRQVSQPAPALGIWEDVTTVIAVPVLDVDDQSKALGTISIDTSLPIALTPFANKETAAVLFNVAKAVAYLWRGPEA